MIFVNLIYRHFDILMSHYGQVNKSYAFLGCANIMLQLHTVRNENLITPQTHLSASSFHEYHSDTPRYPPDIPHTPQDISREHKIPTKGNRHQQSLPDLLKQHLSGCLGVSIGVCWRLLASVEILSSLEMSWGCLGGVLGYLSGIHGNLRRSDVFGGYLGSPSLQYGAVTLFWHSLERRDFFHLTIPRHKNIKMSIYKLDKNH